MRLLSWIGVAATSFDQFMVYRARAPSRSATSMRSPWPVTTRARRHARVPMVASNDVEYTRLGWPRKIGPSRLPAHSFMIPRRAATAASQAAWTSSVAASP